MDFRFRLVPTAITPLKVGAIYDLEERDTGVILLATNNKFYMAHRWSLSAARGSTSLDYMLVNGKDSAVGRQSFRHDENNLQINLSTPFFNQFYFFRYKYRFRDKANTATPWAISDDEQKKYSVFAVLPPGHYLFGRPLRHQPDWRDDCKAGQPDHRHQSCLWYQTGWFTVAAASRPGRRWPSIM